MWRPFSRKSLSRPQLSTIIITNMTELASLALRRLRRVASLDDVNTDTASLFATNAEENGGRLFVASLVDIISLSVMKSTASVFW